MDKLGNENPKAYWKLLKKCKQENKNDEKPENNINIIEWEHYWMGTLLNGNTTEWEHYWMG